ncbi:MAG: hypothetical protein ABDH21_06860 [bacterium]
MDNQAIDKIIKAFKNNKEILSIYVGNQNIMGNSISDSVLNQVLSAIELFRNYLGPEYITFSINDYTIICFKYMAKDVIIFGVKNIKEPIVRSSIKSL